MIRPRGRSWGRRPSPKQIDGDVVVFAGPLTLSGRIDGHLIVVDADIDFREGSAVTGDVTLIGGEAVGVESADVGGTVTMYGEGFGLFRGRDRVFTVDSRSGRVYREEKTGGGNGGTAISRCAATGTTTASKDCRCNSDR